ncbi:MAG: hypothetical protein ACK4UO_07235 [Pseudolabrys sp.]
MPGRYEARVKNIFYGTTTNREAKLALIYPNLCIRRVQAAAAVAAKAPKHVILHVKFATHRRTSRRFAARFPVVRGRRYRRVAKVVGMPLTTRYR